jgi:hypothetical protein
MDRRQAGRRAERLVREFPYLFSPVALGADLRAAGASGSEAGMIVWALIDRGRIVLTPDWLLMPRAAAEPTVAGEGEG